MIQNEWLTFYSAFWISTEVVYLQCCLVLICVMLLVSMKSKAVFQTDTIYSCLLSLVSISLVSHTHSYCSIYMLHSNWEQFSFQPVLHGAGAHATQSHSFHPLTIHSSIRLQTHSHSTDHSLIPQAHAIIPLHIVSSLHILCTPWTMVMSFHAQRHM